MLAEEVPEALDPRRRLFHLLGTEGDRLAIVAGDQVVDDRLATVAVERLGELEDVALRLRHLGGIGLDHPVVHPDPGERPAGRLGLGDLVLVMGKDEVGAAAVDRERGAQLRLGHRRALDVPAGAPRPPRGVPAGVLALLARLPKREVERVLLQRGRAGLLTLVHVLGPPVREFPVPLEAPNPKVDVAPGLIRVSGLDQIGDQPDDPRDRLGGQRLRIRSPQPQPVGVLEIGLGHPRRELRRRLPHLPRRRVDLVVDVGDVDDQPHPIPLGSQKASKQGEDDERPRVPNVNPAVDRRPTRIDPDLTPALERPELPTQRVLDPHLAHGEAEPRRFCNRRWRPPTPTEPTPEPSHRRRQAPLAWPCWRSP